VNLGLGRVAAALGAALVISGCTISTESKSAAAPQPLPTAMSDLGLAGTLIYNASVVRNDQLHYTVQAYHLDDGRDTTIFEGPPDAWLDAAVVSPGQRDIVIAYAPPPVVVNQWQQALYIIPIDGTKSPQLLFPISSAEDQYYQPQWSPDGKFVYFTHSNRQALQQPEIMRIRYPGGQPESVLTDAFWPRLSEDGTRLVYVHIDPQSRVNSLYTSKPDGTDAKPVPLTALSPPLIIDAPMFSPDNRTIFFSAPIATQNYAAGWFGRLFGIIVAKADGTIPSDWWTIGAEGGRPKRLTNIQTLALYGWFSPEGQHIASYSADGVFVMRPDGTQVTLVVPDVRGNSGTVDWIP
jgi:hypothetical protein